VYKGNGTPADNGDGSKSTEAAGEHERDTDDGSGTPDPSAEKVGGEGDEPITAEIDEATVENLRCIVIQAAQITERRQGTLPAHIVGVIEKLRKPELNWKELLKQFVTSCYGGSSASTKSHSVPSRRSSSSARCVPNVKDFSMVKGSSSEGSTVSGHDRPASAFAFSV